ncbi:hypothetical protein ACFSX9_09245 [Flavobacterium ardleyense]|uniref:Uncharacterized protein n=1 Tax=Flavobacterium ardleyense TaxID=2038737 RepID=A0ABW5Z8Y2_9FLAO
MEKIIGVPKYQNYNEKRCYNEKPTGSISPFGKLHKSRFDVKILKTNRFVRVKIVDFWFLSCW